MSFVIIRTLMMFFKNNKAAKNFHAIIIELELSVRKIKILTTHYYKMCDFAYSFVFNNPIIKLLILSGLLYLFVRYLEKSSSTSK